MTEMFVARKGVRSVLSSYFINLNEQRFNVVVSHFFTCDKFSKCVHGYIGHQQYQMFFYCPTDALKYINFRLLKTH